jgi:hypothetical protein
VKQGDVMKESVQCSLTSAIDYIRRNLNKYKDIVGKNLDKYLINLESLSQEVNINYIYEEEEEDKEEEEEEEKEVEENADKVS